MKWAVPKPARTSQSQRHQLKAFKNPTTTPIERMREVIGEEFAQFVSLEFANVFNLDVDYSTKCLESAKAEDSIEYQRRHAFADSIALTEDTSNIKRAQVFLHLLADMWVIDQGLYHTNNSKKRGFCPICQIHFFRRMLTHSSMTPEETDVDSAPTHKHAFKANGLIHHIKLKQGHCLGHSLLAKFISSVHGISFY